MYLDMGAGNGGRKAQENFWEHTFHLWMTTSHSISCTLLLSMALAAAMGCRPLRGRQRQKTLTATWGIKLLAKECICPSLHHHQFTLKLAVSLATYVRSGGLCRMRVPVLGHAQNLTAELLGKCQPPLPLWFLWHCLTL